MNIFIINNFQSIDQEFRVKSDENILSFFLNIDLFIHGSHGRINFKLHFIISDINDDRFFIPFSYKKCGAVNTVQKFFFIYRQLGIIITGKHLINAEVFSLDQS